MPFSYFSATIFIILLHIYHFLTAFNPPIRVYVSILSFNLSHSLSPRSILNVLKRLPFVFIRVQASEHLHRFHFVSKQNECGVSSNCFHFVSQVQLQIDFVCFLFACSLTHPQKMKTKNMCRILFCDIFVLLLFFSYL